MSSALRLILGDQLTRSLASLRDIDPVRHIVLMVEVQDESTYVRQHKQKIASILSAMRWKASFDRSSAGVNSSAASTGIGRA